MEKVTLIKSKFLRNLFDQNTYVLSNGKQAIIIDAGAELEEIKQVIKKQKVLAIFMTHLHFDHFWNLDKYLQEFGCSVYVADGFAWKFDNAKYNGSSIIKREFKKEIPQNSIKFYTKNIKIADFDFEIIETPGHSADSVCILFKDYLFTGDTVFADSVGRVDLIDSDKNAMIQSLSKIRQLKYSTAFPGHYETAEKSVIDRTIDLYI